MTQEEAEQILQLRTTPAFRNPAPARRNFQPPSSAGVEIALRVAAYPGLAAELDVRAVDPNLENRSSRPGHIGSISRGIATPKNCPNAMMIERFRDSPQAELLFHAQAFGLELKESEEDSRQFVRHTVWKLEIGQKNKEIKSMEERLRKGELNRDEHYRYAQMILEVKVLESQLQADARAFSQGPG